MSDWKFLLNEIGGELGKAIIRAAVDGIAGPKTSTNNRKIMHKKTNVVHTDIHTNKFHYREAIERFEWHLIKQGYKNMHNSKRTPSKITETWYNHRTGTTMVGHFHLN